MINSINRNLLSNINFKNALKSYTILLTGILLTLAISFYTKKDIDNQAENEFALVCAEGVGMGLTFCKKVIEQHKGLIWAESEGENKGTTIKIELKN